MRAVKMTMRKQNGRDGEEKQESMFAVVDSYSLSSNAAFAVLL
jgi:hypothetical protein